MRDRIVELFQKAEKHIKHSMRMMPVFSVLFGIFTALWIMIIIRDYSGRSIPPWESVYSREAFFESLGKTVLYFIICAVAFYFESLSQIKFDESGIVYKKKKYAWSEIGYVRQAYQPGRYGSHYQYLVIGNKGEVICGYNDMFLGKKRFEEYLLKNNIGTTKDN